MLLGLPILLGNRNQLFVELGVNFRGEFLGDGWHICTLYYFLSYRLTMIYTCAMQVYDFRIS